MLQRLIKSLAPGQYHPVLESWEGGRMLVAGSIIGALWVLMLFFGLGFCRASGRADADSERFWRAQGGAPARPDGPPRLIR